MLSPVHKRQQKTDCSGTRVASVKLHRLCLKMTRTHVRIERYQPRRDSWRNAFYTDGARVRSMGDDNDSRFSPCYSIDEIQHSYSRVSVTSHSISVIECNRTTRRGPHRLFYP